MSHPIDELAVWLLPGMTPRLGLALRARGAARDVLGDPGAFEDLLGESAAGMLRDGSARGRAEDELRRAAQAGHRLIHRDDAEYPCLLREVADPPPFLYVSGAPCWQGVERIVAIVGARAASIPGRSLARRMARELAEAGVCVISGLARGIDGCAHEGTLEGAGRTVAVLGSGLDRVYPAEHEDLARRIVHAGGAVVSELPLGTAPLARHFPWRNRIIAGCVQAVVVVEAGQRSGALTTARLALECGRDVLAVPGHPAFAGARGSNGLIRDGAPLVGDAQDVLAELGWGPRGRETEREPRPSDPVLELLGAGVPLTIDEIQGRMGLPVSVLLARLTELEMERKVRRLPGSSFVRI